MLCFQSAALIHVTAKCHLHPHNIRHLQGVCITTNNSLIELETESPELIEHFKTSPFVAFLNDKDQVKKLFALTEGILK
jgi:hypothetical protein